MVVALRLPSPSCACSWQKSQPTRALLSQLAVEVASVRARYPTAMPREPLALVAVDIHSYYTKTEALLARILMSFRRSEGRRF
jgi:hypothetical protein